MINNSMDERIIIQVSRCQDKFITKANYYKEKYIQLISLVTCSVGIIFTTIFYSNRLSNDVAVLKDNVKSLKAVIKGQGKIILRNSELDFYYPASIKKEGFYGKQKVQNLRWQRLYYYQRRDRCLFQDYNLLLCSVSRNRGGLYLCYTAKPSNKSGVLKCIISNSK